MRVCVPVWVCLLALMKRFHLVAVLVVHVSVCVWECVCNAFTYSIWCVCFFKVNDGRWANLMSGKDYGELVERERENCLEG